MAQELSLLLLVTSYTLCMTLKQLLFLKEYLRSGNGTQAALKVYNTTNYRSAGVISHQTLHSKEVKQFLRNSLENVGLSDQNIAKYLAQVVEAGTSPQALRAATPTDGLEAIKLAAQLKGLH